jgi:hypothetical protein
LAATDEVDRLIKAAILEPNADTLAAVHRALDSVEVFYRATVSEVGGKQRVKTPLLRLNDGSHALMVYTSKTHPDLPREFGGAPWQHTLKMALQMPQADWLILTNLHGDWLPIGKSQIAQLLGVARGDSPRNGRADTTSSEADDDLDSLIRKAAERPEEDWLESLRRALTGRELFLRLADERAEDGRPKMVTSEVGDVSGLVQAYTTRRRPGIVYGGMPWESIVDMMKNTPDIPGIHIINDSDDWVVVGRSEV